ncbi:MAG: hypothetical protein ACJ74R_06830 [Gaiellaceae bacterium]
METGRTLRETSRTVTGWRAWVVTQTPDGLRLGSVLHDLAWPHGRVVVAECRRDEDPFAPAVGAHPVPGSECNCGFHAARDPVDALSYARGRDEPNTVCRILGEVHLWGHVLETERGWRASHAYPGRLYASDPSLAAELTAYGVPVCASPLSATCTATPRRSVPLLQTWSSTSRT